MSTASELPSLRLDASREEALERAAAIVARAWQSFDRARPGQPDVDERLGELLRAALPDTGSSVLAALDDAAQVLDTSIAQPRPRFFAFVGWRGIGGGGPGCSLGQRIRRLPRRRGGLHERGHDLERHGARGRARAGAAGV